jgi:hypothetical protein
MTQYTKHNTSAHTSKRVNAIFFSTTTKCTEIQKIQSTEKIDYSNSSELSILHANIRLITLCLPLKCQEKSEQIQVNNIKEIIINHINIRRRQRKRERRVTSRKRSLSSSGVNPLIPQGKLSKGHRI